ncbi:hypothetical protein N7505_007820 [Penicillium chrysogenum]|uniref:Protein HRI1 n=1 Tax=Penicillium chrysogenum TaxID=5076 RepID=A0ABQ8WEG6_PENCH|nr:hypothetical protein N7505_007820 [Penicillium chrysogenum]
MGQYWQVVCPPRREYATQSCDGKLSELAFSSWTNILFDLVEYERTPCQIQHDDLHSISAEDDAPSRPLRYDVIESEFGLWSYEEEGEAATLTAMGKYVPKTQVLRNLTTNQYVFEKRLPSGISLVLRGEYLAKGDWAGHDVDIVGAGMLENMNGEWQDVTDDIRDEVQVLRSSDFGDDWETEWRA